jgi:nitroimidazol reductase NimA-like FMN-containing flavoprotein (pyridoxamine 5'-phosphate oxidase superfamily)
MIVEEMSELDCLAMLERTETAYLACARDNQPYVVPVRVDFEGGFVYAYSMEGQKIEFMRQNPLVCLLINDVTSRRQWRSVIVYGRYEELPNRWDYQDARRIAQRLFQRHAMWWEPASAPLPAHAPQAPVVFRIHVDRVSGRRAKPAVAEPDRHSDADATLRRPGASLLRRVVAKYRAALSTDSTPGRDAIELATDIKWRAPRLLSRKRGDA